MAYKGYDPDTDMPDLSGKVIFITGGTGGVGKTAVLELIKHNPAHVVFTGRNQSAADEVLSAAAPTGVKMTFIRCDLTSLDSIRRAAKEFTSSRLDIFIANAGVMAQPLGTTKDGYEIHFGINHVGNAALLFRLLPVMQRTAEQHPDVRFVSVTSLGYFSHPRCGIDFANLKSTQQGLLFGSMARYAQSKLANILTAKEVGRRYPKITSVAVHPGVVQTELVAQSGWFHRILIQATNPGGLMTPRQGCYNTLWAATSPDVRRRVEEGGRVAFFEPVAKPNSGDASCFDEDLAKRLWEWTEAEVGVKA